MGKPLKPMSSLDLIFRKKDSDFGVAIEDSGFREKDWKNFVFRSINMFLLLPILAPGYWL